MKAYPAYKKSNVEWFGISHHIGEQFLSSMLLHEEEIG